MRSPRWWMERPRRQRALSPDESWRVLRWRPATTAALLVVVLGGALAMWLLGVWAPIPANVTDPSRLKLDRVRTGLTVVAGLAAGVTLLVTLRRQALSERAQRFSESDALEQRTTALYAAAADQLGSDKAAVRLAGLYVFDRLGRDNPKLRQTVFDVWCAYLRMPYTPPADVLRRGASPSPEPSAGDAEPSDAVMDAERREELVVRLTAQRLLGAHLGAGQTEAAASTYWLTDEGTRLTVDLVGSTLVDFDARGWSVGRANFESAQFYRPANLRTARFDGDLCLSNAHFHDRAALGELQVHGYAEFWAARFDEVVVFSGAQFHRGASLTGVKCRDAVDLSGAHFHGDAILQGARFNGPVRFDGTQFHKGLLLCDALFVKGFNLNGALATSKTNLPEGWALSVAAEEEEGGLLPVVRAPRSRE